MATYTPDQERPSNDNADSGLTEEERRANRLKRIRFRAWHRGIREMDLLIGGFADLYLADLSDAELDGFETILRTPDQELYDIVIRDAAPDYEIDADLLNRVRLHCQNSPLS